MATSPPTVRDSHLESGGDGRLRHSDGPRISASYNAGVLTWTEYTSHRPASPTYRPAPVSEPSRQELPAGDEPKRTGQRPRERLGTMQPAQLEAMMAVVLVVVCAGVFGVAKYLTQPPHQKNVVVGTTPNAVAVDQSTHTVYVTDNLPGTVSEIDGYTHTVTATVPVGYHPDGVAVDPGTHTVYVANSDSETVSVIDGSTHTVTATVPVGNTPTGLAVDPETHMVYVANSGYHTVSVIDGKTHTVTASVPVGHHPFGVAVDPSTHNVYVTDFADAKVSVIDGSTHTVADTMPVGDSPDAVALDPDTSTVYVTNYADHTVSLVKAR
jgi:YVTN family beta-propeller protein